MRLERSGPARRVAATLALALGVMLLTGLPAFFLLRWLGVALWMACTGSALVALAAAWGAMTWSLARDLRRQDPPPGAYRSAGGASLAPDAYRPYSWEGKAPPQENAAVSRELSRLADNLAELSRQVKECITRIDRFDQQLARVAAEGGRKEAAETETPHPLPELVWIPSGELVPEKEGADAAPEALSAAARWVMDPVSLRAATSALAGLDVEAAQCVGEHPGTQWVRRDVEVDGVPEAFFVQRRGDGHAWLVPNHPAYAPLEPVTSVRNGTSQLNRMVRTVVRFPRGRVQADRFEVIERGVVDLDR